MSKDLDDKIEKLQELCDIQCSEGNWNHSPYMHGMANGIIFAIGVLTNDSPEFLTEPDTFLCDFKALDKFNNSPIIVANTKLSNKNETD